MLRILLIFTCYFLALLPSQAKELIYISAAEVYINSFKKVTNNRACADLKTAEIQGAIPRGVADLLIICHAFNESAMDVEFIFTAVPNYVRGYMLVKAGKVHLNAETIWENQHDTKLFYLSVPIIEQGEFEVGIYVPPYRTDLLAITSLEELQKYTAVSQRSWVNDWALLERLALKRIHSVSTISQMFKMVGHGRIDFLLWTFTSNKLMSQKIHDIELYPIPNLKFVIPDSRHFAISKSAPNAYKIFHALNAGILQLKQNGILHKIYTQAGFINPKVSDWKDITPLN
ncbi:MAG: substrate-binding periplasmic protein [Thalassotalea sp.]